MSWWGTRVQCSSSVLACHVCCQGQCERPEGVRHVRAACAGHVRADAPGRWEFRCNVQHHFNAGMKGVLAITPTDLQLDALALPSY